jgi:hypothetical protein
MSAWIILDITAGTSIETACADAQRVSDILGINVEFKFNGVKCFAGIGGNAELLAKRQQWQQSRKLEGPLDTRLAHSFGEGH